MYKIFALVTNQIKVFGDPFKTQNNSMWKRSTLAKVKMSGKAWFPNKYQIN